MRTINTILTTAFCLVFVSAQAQNTTFTKTFGGSSNEQSSKIAQFNNGDYLMLSTTESYGNGSSSMYLVKTNGLGDILWSYTYGTNLRDVATSMRITQDGGALICGYSSGSGDEDGMVFKINSSGVVQWTKAYQSDTIERLYDVMESRSGDVYVTGYRMFDSLSKNIIVSKLTSGGGVLWYKHYGGFRDDEGYSLAEDGYNRIVVVGSTANDSVIIGDSGDMDIQVLRLQANNGNVMWSKNYGTTSNDQALAVKVSSDDKYYITGWTEGSSLPGENMMLLVLDTAGATLSSRSFGTGGDDRAYDLDIDANGIISIVGTIEGMSSPRDIALIRTNSNGIIISSTVLGGSDTDAYQPMALLKTTDGGYTVLGNGRSFAPSGDKDLYMIRTDRNGFVSCGSKLEFLDPVSYNISSNGYTASSSLAEIFNNSITRTSISSSDSTLCCELEARVAADTIVICRGEQAALGATAITGYAYFWTQEGTSYQSGLSNPQVSPDSNSTYKLLVKAASGGCTPDSAYVYVKVNSRLTGIDFARDSFFCEGSNVQVGAYPGMNSYTWTGTGYTYSSIPVTFNQEDSVFLTVIDNNSCIYRDTIFIDEIATPVFELKPDTSICENSSITYTGPANMTEYIWNGQSSTNQTYTTNISQIHKLEVVNSYGCTYRDSVILQTKPVSTFSLGADTFFCSGGVYTIIGPGALSGYIWNGIPSFQANLEVDQAGTYRLTAFNSYQCPFSDTIIISEVAPPVFSLGPDDEFCEGGSRTLTGPSGYTYLWSNSSDEDEITVNDGGLYYLMVTDDNGCQYTDSIEITEFPNPVISLGNDTVVCPKNGFPLTLSPGNGFADYDWSTGSTQTVIQVNLPGNYSVTVTDNNGCIGSTDINIDTNYLLCPGSGSIDYLGVNRIKIYPNPASSYLIISAEELLHNSSVILSDIYGRVLFRDKILDKNYYMNLEDVAPGQYFIAIEQDLNRVQFKVMVNR